MENGIRCIYVSTNELTASVFDYFEQIKKGITVDQMETLLSNLILDAFAVSTTEGHLDNTLNVLEGLNITGDHAFYLATTIYNQLLFLVHVNRLSDNLNYLDKLSVDLVSPCFIKLTYDPKKKIFNTYSF